LGFTAYNPASAPLPPTPGLGDSLFSDDVTFPLAAGMRLEVSRKLDNNVTLAGTYWGLQHWSVGRTIYADPSNETYLAFTPLLQLPSLFQQLPLRPDGGLDDSLSYTYGSQIENVEINAFLRLNPGDPYWEVNWLWGARYIYYSENFSLDGSDAQNSATEQLSYDTTNNLIGAQTGLLIVRGWSHFQWEGGLKVGLMANFYHQHGVDAASNPPTTFVPYDVSNSGSSLAGLFEVSVGVRYRLTDNLGLRLGYQFYDITGLALAPRQLTNLGHGGNVAFDGLSIGLQGTW
jgi:opacity protein-like surface antigen